MTQAVTSIEDSNGKMPTRVRSFLKKSVNFNPIKKQVWSLYYKLVLFLTLDLNVKKISRSLTCLFLVQCCFHLRLSASSA